MLLSSVLSRIGEGKKRRGERGRGRESSEARGKGRGGEKGGCESIFHILQDVGRGREKGEKRDCGKEKRGEGERRTIFRDSYIAAFKRKEEGQLEEERFKLFNSLLTFSSITPTPLPTKLEKRNGKEKRGKKGERY